MISGRSDYDFGSLHLRNGNFAGTLLYGSNFAEADCRGANFRRAHLRGVNGRRANFAGADFSEAQIEDCDLMMLLPSESQSWVTALMSTAWVSTVSFQIGHW